MGTTVREELDELRREIATEQPELAGRLARIADQLTTTTRPTREYISTGEAATALSVSPNTIKKWVRVGVIRDFWMLPGSGYIKIARSEVERLRAVSPPAESDR